MTLIDANYFLRWFLNDIPAQNQQVKQLLISSAPESIVLDRITIAEITYVLRGLGYNHRQIALAVGEFCNIDSIKHLDGVLMDALKLFGQTSLDFEDCWLASLAHKKAYAVSTFDKALDKHITSTSDR